MDNTQDVPVNVRPSVAKTPEPTFDNGPSVVGKKDRKTAWILAIVLLLIIAAGGVGFGVWAYMDGNTQREQLNAQIGLLTQQNSELQEKLSNNSNANSQIGGDGVLGSSVNPIVDVQNSDRLYTLRFSSSNVLEGSKIVDITINKGDVTSCVITEAEFLEYGGTKKSDAEDCSVTGLSGKVYKVVEFGAGHDNSSDYIGFIMTDGSVEYLPLYDSVNSNDFTIKGKLKIDGKVVDSLVVGVSNDEAGWGGTVFVLNDGTVLEYDESMLN